MSAENQQLSTHKKAMIEALKKTLGIVTKAAELAGIERTTHYLWMNNDEEYKKEVESISDIALDFVESKLFEKINGVQIGKHDKDGELIIYEQPPSDTAAIFYLKTKGKKRGYIEKQEIDHTTNGKDIQPIQIEIVKNENTSK